MYFGLVIKRKFSFGKLCDDSHLHSDYAKHNIEVLGQPEKHDLQNMIYKLKCFVVNAIAHFIELWIHVGGC